MKALESEAAALGLTLRVFESGTLNITTNDGREMARDDVEAFRALLAEHGLTEVRAWVATQGRSWLSDGVFAGVSFQVKEVATDA